MRNAEVRVGVNEFEAIQVGAYMEENYPGTYYVMTPGNDCVWVYWSFMNLYFIFRDGRIADIQVD